MSDHSISIVPRQSTFQDNKQKAKEILDWLVTKDIIKPKLSDCILNSDKGYAISTGAKQITVFPNNLPINLTTNGLEIITERQVFDTGENFVNKLTCPNCSENIVFDDWDLSPWSNNESNNLTCPRCGQDAEIHNFLFEPEWGFSDLGFRFWNFPNLTHEFIEDFKRKLGCDISIVNQHF